MALSLSDALRPAPVSRAARSGGVEVGPTHQAKVRPVGSSSVTVSAMRRPAARGVNWAAATMLNVSSSSPLSAITRSSALITFAPASSLCR